MKNLTITFALAVSLICSAVIYNKIQHDEQGQSSTTVAKTIVETDDEGRPSVEMTMVISGNRWVERSKKLYAYSNNCTIETLYNCYNGDWVAEEKIISSYNNNSLIKTVSYSLADNETWVESSKESFDDLSYDDGMMHDLVFDKDGNLIMSAVYKWDDDSVETGVEKVEYVYDNNGIPMRHISYCWVGDTWQKTEVSDFLYITQ